LLLLCRGITTHATTRGMAGHLSLHGNEVDVQSSEDDIGFAILVAHRRMDLTIRHGQTLRSMVRQLMALHSLHHRAALPADLALRISVFDTLKVGGLIVATDLHCTATHMQLL
jgi:hypothetical protein